MTASDTPSTALPMDDPLSIDPQDVEFKRLYAQSWNHAAPASAGTGAVRAVWRELAKKFPFEDTLHRQTLPAEEREQRRKVGMKAMHLSREHDVSPAIALSNKGDLSDPAGGIVCAFALLARLAPGLLSQACKWWPAEAEAFFSLFKQAKDPARWEKLFRACEPEARIEWLACQQAMLGLSSREEVFKNGAGEEPVRWALRLAKTPELWGEAIRIARLSSHFRPPQWACDARRFVVFDAPKALKPQEAGLLLCQLEALLVDPTTRVELQSSPDFLGLGDEARRLARLSRVESGADSIKAPPLRREGEPRRVVWSDEQASALFVGVPQLDGKAHPEAVRLSHRGVLDWFDEQAGHRTLQALVTSYAKVGTPGWSASKRNRPGTNWERVLEEVHKSVFSRPAGNTVSAALRAVLGSDAQSALTWLNKVDDRAPWGESLVFSRRVLNPRWVRWAHAREAAQNPQFDEKRQLEALEKAKKTILAGVVSSEERLQIEKEFAQPAPMEQPQKFANSGTERQLGYLDLPMMQVIVQSEKVAQQYCAIWAANGGDLSMSASRYTYWTGKIAPSWFQALQDHNAMQKSLCEPRKPTVEGEPRATQEMHEPASRSVPEQTVDADPVVTRRRLRL